MFRSRRESYRRLFLTPSFAACRVSLVCVLQQVHYSAEWVQEPQKDEALCDNYEELKTVKCYREVLHLSYGRVH